MIIKMEMLKRCHDRELPQEVTPEIVAAGESSREKAKESLGLEWPELDEKFWNWVGRYQLSLNPENNVERPHRGLLICGPVGTGKTTLAKYISCKFGINFYTFQELDRSWGSNPDNFFDDYPEVADHHSSIILDDLGSEAGEKHYGNEPLTKTLLMSLYHNWDLWGKLVIITTNLIIGEKFQNMPTSITNIFGERNHSRFCDMFETVKLLGNDRRKHT